MEAVSSDICSHINTDKKWLEENLLCLTSNAVKFQMEGVVAVRCTVVEGGDAARGSGCSLRSGVGPESALGNIY
jgi:hypothetical protein